MVGHSVCIYVVLLRDLLDTQCYKKLGLLCECELNAILCRVR